MPPLLFFAGAAIVGYIGYRKFIAEAEKVSERVRRQEREQQTGATGTLVQDPETGEYRPAEIEESERR